MSYLPIQEHQIKLKPSVKLTEYILNKIKDTENCTANIALIRTTPADERGNCYLTLEDIRWLKNYTEKRNKRLVKKVYVYELLEGSSVQMPQLRRILRDPVLEERIKKLQYEQDARDYKAMTKDVDPVRKHLPEDTIAFQMKLMNKQLIAVLQFVFSVIAGFAFGFIGVELIVGNLDFGFRLLLGIICALVIALAEIYFLAKKLSEDYDDVPPGSASKKLHEE